MTITLSSKRMVGRACSSTPTAGWKPEHNCTGSLKGAGLAGCWRGEVGRVLGVGGGGGGGGWGVGKVEYIGWGCRGGGRGESDIRAIAIVRDHCYIL